MQLCGSISLAVVIVCSASALEGQRPTDFSGTWSLISAPGMGASGSGSRGGRGGGGRVISEVRGALFNCGTTCTIVQTAKGMTVSRPPDEKGVKPRDTVVNFDGLEARWDGAKLVVTRTITGSLNVSQTLSIENRQLRVVSSFSVEGDVPVTMIYEKK